MRLAGQMKVTPIPGFVGYGVSRDGKVWSKWKRGPGDQMSPNWRPMRTFTDKDGYATVGIYRDGRQRHRHVHTLLLLTFRGPRPSKRHQCRHLDGDNSNNSLRNLRWGTPSQNAIDRVRHGTCPLLAKGITHPAAVLTDEQIQEVLTRALSGVEMQKDIAAAFGISQGYVSGIKRYRGRDPRKRKERRRSSCD